MRSIIKKISELAQRVNIILLFLSTLFALANILNGNENNVEFSIPEKAFEVRKNQYSGLLPYHSNYDINQPNNNIENILIFIHGLDTIDSILAYNLALHVIQQADKNDGCTLVIAPHFLNLADANIPSTENRPLLLWDRFPRDSHIFAHIGKHRTNSNVTSYDALDQLVLSLVNNNNFNNLKNIIVAGQSAGGQFVDRYAMANHIDNNGFISENVLIRYLPMNSYFRIYLTEKRVSARNPIKFADMPDDAFTWSDNYPLGLSNLSDHFHDMNRQDIQERFRNRRVHYLIGEHENQPQNSIYPYMLLGANRLERAIWHFAHLQHVFGNEISKNHHLSVVPGFGHSWQVLAHPIGLNAAFGEDWVNRNSFEVLVSTSDKSIAIGQTTIVEVRFPFQVSELSIDHFRVVNGIVTNIVPRSDFFEIEVVPTNPGQMSIEIPIGRVYNQNGDFNLWTSTVRSDIFVEVENIEQLQAIGTSDSWPLDATYVLTNDIDASQTQTWNNGLGFKPIGIDYGFKGSLDGNGHTIRNLYINRQSDENVGLFSELASGGSVKNLGVEHSNITGRLRVGTVAGKAHTNALIKGVFVSGSVTGESAVGGIIGQSHGKLIDSWAKGNIVATGWDIGGLVGYQFGLIKRCFSRVRLPSSGGARGGLAGYGLLGQVELSFWDKDVSEIESSAGGVGISSDMLTSNILFRNAEWHDTPWRQKIGKSPVLWWQDGDAPMISQPTNPPWVGNGSSDDPFIISSISEFKEISLFAPASNSVFILASDLNLEYLDTHIPIGSLKPFGGIFEGEGRLISNLTLGSNGPFRQADDFLGVFSRTNSNAIIRNLRIKGLKLNGGMISGALVGFNEGLIENVYVEGEVRNQRWYTGGLVGLNSGGTIRRCLFEGTVHGNRQVGGIAGANHPGSYIYQCATYGRISTFRNAVGGIVGASSNSHIMNSYSAAEIHAEHDDSEAGGLVGHLRDGFIYNSYSRGPVFGNTRGGLVATIHGSPTVQGSYWDHQASNTSFSAAGISAESNVLKSFPNSPLFVDWSLGDVWVEAAANEDGYPTLSGSHYLRHGVQGLTGDYKTVEPDTATTIFAPLLDGFLYQWYEGPSGFMSRPISEANSNYIYIERVSDATYWVRLKTINGMIFSSPSFILEVNGIAKNLDDWLINHFGLNHTLNPNIDTVLKGSKQFSLKEAFLLGENPNDPNDTINILIEDGNELSFKTLPGRVYSIEISTDLLNWHEQHTWQAGIHAPAGRFNFPICSNNQRAFYRIRVSYPK